MYRIQTEFTGLPGTPYLSTMYFNEVAGSVEDAHAAVAAFWGDLANDLCGGLVWEVLPDVAIINATTGLTTGVETVPVVQGEASGAASPLPYATQGLIRWSTGIFEGGREIKGKTYLPGMITGGNTAGRPNAGALQAFQSAVDVILSAAGSELVIWSRKNLSAATATGGSPWNQYAVLRSRRD